MCANCLCQTPTNTTFQDTLTEANDNMRTYKVEGMTCGHCKTSVTEEVSQIPGVGSVDVDVALGTVTVSGDVSEDDVKAAVEEAGYRVTS